MEFWNHDPRWSWFPWRCHNPRSLRNEPRRSSTKLRIERGEIPEISGPKKGKGGRHSKTAVGTSETGRPRVGVGYDVEFWGSVTFDNNFGTWTDRKGGGEGLPLGVEMRDGSLRLLCGDEGAETTGAREPLPTAPSAAPQPNPQGPPYDPERPH